MKKRKRQNFNLTLSKMTTSIKEADAQKLFNIVVANDVAGVEKLLRGGNSVTWREVIRYELSLAKMLDNTQSIAALKVLHKLMAYEIITMSSFHAAAMMGHNDIIVALLDKDIPVDIALNSGTTALHLASFAGEVDTVKILKDVYVADINKQDRYGWSALHYACTEGHKDLVKYLKSAGIDLYLRDKDGTTGAFRAQANNHDDLVSYLCKFGDEDDLLNVYEDVGAQASSEDLYSKPNKPEKKEPPPIAKPEKPPKPPLKKTLSGNHFQIDDNLYDYAGGERKGSTSSTGGDKFKSKTLPSRKSTTRASTTGKNTVRRLIRYELENAFAGDYMEPDTLKKQLEKQKTPRLSNVSVSDLKAVMREELERFKAQTGLNPPSGQSYSPEVDEDNNNDYEDLYATLKALPRPPSPPAPGAPGPPLPPRNDTIRPGTQTLALRALDNAISEFDTGTLASGMTLGRSVPNAALSESFQRLAPKLGDNWKQLAVVLPIASSSSKVGQRIMEIEAEFPDSKERQAATALGEWRNYRGKGADVDALIIALRKCKLQDVIPDVEKVTQEFTA